jgi:hypothetical protein
MHTGTFRIVQISDSNFTVEELRMVPRDSWKPWVKRRWVEEWNRVRFGLSAFHSMAPLVPPFLSVEAAQKWIDDKRQYPLVVKQPA